MEEVERVLPVRASSRDMSDWSSSSHHSGDADVDSDDSDDDDIDVFGASVLPLSLCDSDDEDDIVFEGGYGDASSQWSHVSGSFRFSCTLALHIPYSLV